MPERTAANQHAFLSAAALALLLHLKALSFPVEPALPQVNHQGQSHPQAQASQPLEQPGAAAPENRVTPVEVLAREVRAKGWIAYSARSVHGDWDLCLCRPDGSDVRPLTRTPQHSEFSPQFSRDGRRLLFRRMPPSEKLDNNRHGEQGELVLADADASHAVTLGKPGELPWASFSPDGASVASLSIQGISVFDLERRQTVGKLPRKGFFQQATWSPDGKWLTGVANSFGASWSIARMDLATGEATAVNRVDCCTPDWFPDSRQIVFSWRPPGQKANQGYGWTQLWRAAADGSGRQLIYAEEGRHVYGGHVSPDGQYVLFTGNLEEDGDPGRAGAPMGLMRLSDAPTIGGASPEFRALHPATKDGPVVTLPTGWEPCWTANAFDPHGDPAALPGTPAPGSAGTAQSSTASLKQDLQRAGWIVCSARSDSGDWDLFTLRPDGSGRQARTSTPEFNEAGARFSPDGRYLLYYRVPRNEPIDNNNFGTFELAIANADGTGPQIWGRGFDWACWDPTSRQIACLDKAGIRIVDLATRKTLRLLPRKGIVSQLTWSPDGQCFSGTANGLGPAWNIGCLSLASGEIVAVSETERYNCTADWAPDSRRIVYARGIVPDQTGRAELWAADVSGVTRQRLYAEPGRHIYGACSSPDGRHLVFTRSVDDLGKVAAIEMAVIRWPAPGATAAPEDRLDLGPGWEPHWSAACSFPP